MSKDILYFDNYEIPSRIGTTPEERSQLQPLLISVKIEWDLKKSGRTDNLKDTLDYAAVAEDIRTAITAREFNLMEAAAEAIATIITSKYQSEFVEVRVEKKVYPNMKGAGVIIRRTL